MSVTVRVTVTLEIFEVVVVSGSGIVLTQSGG